MNVRITRNETTVSPAQVWSGLTTECQARVIQFLARLASHFLSEESISTPWRSPHDDSVFRPQDPAGSSRPSGAGLRPPIHPDSSPREHRQRRPAI
jgi:hypothetical protein